MSPFVRLTDPEFNRDKKALSSETSVRKSSTVWVVCLLYIGTTKGVTEGLCNCAE